MKRSNRKAKAAKPKRPVTEADWDNLRDLLGKLGRATKVCESVLGYAEPNRNHMYVCAIDAGQVLKWASNLRRVAFGLTGRLEERKG